MLSTTHLHSVVTSKSFQEVRDAPTGCNHRLSGAGNHSTVANPYAHQHDPLVTTGVAGEDRLLHLDSDLVDTPKITHSGSEGAGLKQTCFGMAPGSRLDISITLEGFEATSTPSRCMRTTYDTDKPDKIYAPSYQKPISSLKVEQDFEEPQLRMKSEADFLEEECIEKGQHGQKMKEMENYLLGIGVQFE